MQLGVLEKELLSLFLQDSDYEVIREKKYESFSYPRVIKLMRFETKRYKASGFGHAFSMQTKGPFGMELLTISFTLGEGASVPFLLIDIMSVGKKRTVFVEYYDCTSHKEDAAHAALIEVKKKYDHLLEYAEKPHWYVGERTPYSLVKCGTAADDDALVSMVKDSVNAYKEECKVAEIDKNNIEGLLAFRERMIKEGNPSSAVLEKVFGKEGAEEFFKKCVMAV
jgi:hypothetical protein